eukprot:6343305-Prymnesium_polylepis.1
MPTDRPPARSASWTPAENFGGGVSSVTLRNLTVTTVTPTDRHDPDRLGQQSFLRPQARELKASAAQFDI